MNSDNEMDAITIEYLKFSKEILMEEYKLIDK
jgi:hypothetical protein